MNQPRVSVLLPVYNSENYLSAAIDSILNQTFKDFELLILNDGSTDNSIQIIEEKMKQDKRIILLENEQNRGLIFTLNKGLKIAKYEYVARMDADDIAMPERFAKQVAYLDAHKDIAVLGTNYEIFGDEQGFSSLETSSDAIALNLYFENAMAHPTVMMRASFLKENDIFYNKEFLHFEDWGMWLLAASKGKLANIPDCLLKYRIEGQNISVKNISTLKERAKKMYTVFLPEIYDDVMDSVLLDNHWVIAKSIYQGESIKAVQARYNLLNDQLLKNNRFSKELIRTFLDAKKTALFFKIADHSSKKAAIFLLKNRLFKQKLIRYWIGSLRSK